MRIVLVKKLISSVGGSEAQARALAGGLRERGHDVRLVGLRPAWRRPGIPAGRPGELTVQEEGLTFRYLATPFAPVDGLLGTSLISWRRLSRTSHMSAVCPHGFSIVLRHSRSVA